MNQLFKPRNIDKELTVIEITKKQTNVEVEKRKCYLSYLLIKGLLEINACDTNKVKSEVLLEQDNIDEYFNV